MFDCPDDRAGGKERLGSVDWDSQEIKAGGSPSRAGGHLTFPSLTSCLSIFSRLQREMGCCPSPLTAARATVSVAAGLCTEVSCMLSVADCKMCSQPFTPQPPALISMRPFNVTLQLL